MDDVDTITAHAKDMSKFLKESDLTESRAFLKSFVKGIVVSPGEAAVRYTVPMPEDNQAPGFDAEEAALRSPVLSTVNSGGPKELVCLRGDEPRQVPPLQQRVAGSCS